MHFSQAKRFLSQYLMRPASVEMPQLPADKAPSLQTVHQAGRYCHGNNVVPNFNTASPGNMTQTKLPALVEKDFPVVELVFLAMVPATIKLIILLSDPGLLLQDNFADAGIGEPGRSENDNALVGVDAN